MKKSIITLALVLLAVAAQAQTAFKIHNTGRISLQSSTTSYGIQIPTSGVASFQPNVFVSYGRIVSSKAFNLLAKAWIVHNTSPSYITDVFYVLGNGNVYSYGQYTITPSTPGAGGERLGSHPIENATELISGMKGYYIDSNEFEGITPEDITENENVKPEAVEGLLHDMELSRTAGFLAEEMEEVLPEAVRHDPDGMAGINYNAVVAVLVEAFKEQQARIEQLESILREHGMMESK